MGTDCRWYALSLSVIESDAFKRMEEVAELHLQSKSPYQIARQLGIKVIEAKAAIEQYEDILRNDADAKDAARDHLNLMVARYDRLISDANDNLVNLKAMIFDEKVSAQINTTIKTIGDLDAKRVDLLQKAGLLDAHDLGDELVEREEREAMLLGILRNDLCDHCKIVVRDKITQMTGTVQGTVVEGEVVDR